MQDTGHVLFDKHGCGADKRQILDEQIKSGERSFRDVSEEMWGSLNVPFDDGFEIMKEELELDVHFRDFHDYCVKNDIPFNVISAGLKPVLRRVLDTFLGEEAVRYYPTLYKPLDLPGPRDEQQLTLMTCNSLPRSTS
jgi:2-hydroxy-3-keto-5-methylthiopentenyl-1-phosphate phosphatase